jgi:heme-degrading monooxygenase HmoA
MHARSAVVEVDVDKIDDAVRFWNEEQLPNYRNQPGYKGFTLLVDRESGKLFGVSFWENEEAVRSSDELAQRARSGLAEAGQGTEQTRENWEVAIDDSL